MSNNPDTKFTSLTAKMGGIVAAHASVGTAIVEHGKWHAQRRYQSRAKAEAEQAMMKDIPEGGYK
jgi:hypothetical protein